MNDPLRPDPDQLLASLKREEVRLRRGRLKVFLGMCPGVGKTYAMLRAAQRERSDGTDIVVGVVETHGRKETEAMLEGLPVVHRKILAYRGASLTEMDLEAILARRPAVVLVDELAHTNVPGSRHAKRWQDVLELLDAGIEVLTTLNIQHVESRADSVRQITGAPVHETVPDSLLDLADELELLDLTSEALLERLRDGKVYLGDRAQAAKDNFFQESHLNALRELALRYTAERVERQLRAQRAGTAKQTVWRSGDRLLVAVGPSPFSTQLVRWTRRLAAALGAPWIAVYVEGSAVLAPEAQALLDKNLGLARELGAEVVITHDDDVPAALVRLALQRNATQIVLGKPRDRRWLDLLKGGSIVDRVVRLGGNIDIHVVPAEPATTRRHWPDLEEPFRSGWDEYAWVAGVVALVTGAGLLFPSEYYLTVGLVYLLAIIALSLRVGRWPVLFAGIAGAIIWNFLFIPPRFTFQINRIEDATLFVACVAVSLIAGQLTARIRAQGRHEALREERATALFHLTRSLAEARTLDEAMTTALRQVDDLFDAKTALLLSDPADARLHPHFSGTHAVDEKELGVAQWSFQNRRPAGRFTDTLPSSPGYHLPLLRGETALGVLGLYVPSDESLTLAQRDLLDSFARLIALAVEREHLRAASEREKLLAESDRLHRTLLDSVSHELRTPLAVITSSVENLDTPDPALRESLVTEARTAAHRLNRLVGNLLDQTRLESGALKPRPDWCDAGDIVRAALDGVRDALSAHPLEILIPEEGALVRADFALTEQVIANLLLNAARHTPPGTPILVTAGVTAGTSGGADRFFFTVADRGPGFPPSMRDRLFKKFARGDAARAGGLGLGLSIARGFIVAQGGELMVGENPGGGAVFTVYLPHTKPQPPPQE